MGPINKTPIKDTLKNIKNTHIKNIIMGPINKTHIKDILKNIYYGVY